MFALILSEWFTPVFICTSDLCLLLFLCGFKKRSGLSDPARLFLLIAVLAYFQEATPYGGNAAYYLYIGVNILVLFLTVWRIGRRTVLQSFYYVTLYYVLTDTLVYLHMFVMRTAFGIDYLVFGPLLWNRLLANLILFSLKLFFILVLRKVLPENVRPDTGIMLGILIGTTFLLYLYIRNCSFWLKIPDLDMNPSFVPLILILSFTILMELIAASRLLFSQKQQMEIQRLEWMLQKQQEQFALKKEAREDLKHRYHDQKHLLRGLLAMTGEETLRSRIQKELDLSSSETLLFECGNEVFDILLTDSLLRCQKNGVVFLPQIDGDGWNQISPVDLSVLFGNLLENAIENAGEVPDPELRCITWKAGKNEHYLFSSLHNTYAHPLIQKDDHLQSTKDQAAFHGFGLDSARRVIEKYDGEMDIDIRDGEFTVRFMIPLAE